MSTSAMKILCRYQYDPLDRLTGLKPADHVDTQRFYQNDELVNEIEGQLELTILRHEAQPLAQRLHIANVTETTLLATDQQRSVLHTLAGVDAQPMAYTAYGHRSAQSGLSSLLGFNGERPDSITGHYLLGQGNRAFNPVLMRFNSPDELSPFGDGGINAYAYCGGDPVNRYDPSGNSPIVTIFKPWNFVKLHRPWETLNGLEPSSRAISRTASRSSPEVVPGPPSELLQRSSTNIRPEASISGRRRPTAAELPPEKPNTKPHPQKNPPTKAQLKARTTVKKLRDYSQKWDHYVENNPQTSIDADLKWHNLYEKALHRYEHARENPNAKQWLLSSRLSVVTRARQRIKRSAWENLKSIRNQQT
ncbi:RHS repeat-associated core domain-containing protein [Pseudomonas sp. Z1-12]|uniref:RHS repeat-associated core domain-containing protein n=1 Tax=Pseudomonas sp. Z1-12 TaxID=2817408 RepID=UPI003DAA4CA9